MKYCINSLAVILILSSCEIMYPGYDLYNTVTDEYKNQTISYTGFSITAKPLIKDYSYGIHNISVNHRFETVSNPEGMVSSLFMVLTSRPLFNLQPTIYIRTDSGISECRIESINNAVRIQRDESSTTTTAVTTTTEKTDNNSGSGISASSNSISNRNDSNKEDPKVKESTETKVTQSNDVSEYTVKDIRFRVILDDELRKRISQTSKMQIRFYLDEYPYNITFSESQIGRVKVILSNRK